MRCGDCPTAETIVHGAAGLAKAALGIGRAGEAPIRIRRRECFFCDRARPCLGVVGRACECAECKCVIRAKTANAHEHCPLDLEGGKARVVHGACTCKWCSAVARFFAAVKAGRCPVSDDGRPSEPGPDGRCACRHCEGIRAAIAAGSNAG